MSEEKSRRRTPYPTEMRERAIRMVLDHQDEYSSQWAAIGSVAEKLSINREALRLWVRRAETDEGKRSPPDPTTVSTDRTTWWTGTSRLQRPTGCGWPTSPT